jgi:hypothetical protein
MGDEAQPDTVLNSLFPPKRGEGGKRGFESGNDKPPLPGPFPPSGEAREKIGTVSRYALCDVSAYFRLGQSTLQTHV